MLLAITSFFLQHKAASGTLEIKKDKIKSYTYPTGGYPNEKNESNQQLNSKNYRIFTYCQHNSTRPTISPNIIYHMRYSFCFAYYHNDFIKHY